LVIKQVVPGGQGEKIGAQPGDVIVSYNGFDIIDQLQMIELVDAGAGSERKLVLDRSGKRVDRIVRRGKVGIAMQGRPKAVRSGPEPASSK
jgi:S1-C subfamily serine protease